jgi:UDP-N-acetylmuramate--alanine ligase
MKHAIKHLHFVGIGGAGMSAIAEVLHHQGYRVSGSDLHASAVTQRLSDLGLHIFIGHDASHIAGAQAVVTSTAVQADNPEVLAARAHRIPVVVRAVLLAELMRLKQGIAIAGTHGKTTTTSLVASVLSEAGVDPTFVIGGMMLTPRPPQAVSAPQGDRADLGRPGARAESAQANARLGAGDYIVVEADESDASFLHLSPVISVVTNIDADHMETYGHDLARLHGAFVDFLHRLPFYGTAVLCTDDAGVRAVLPQLQRPVLRYGMNEDADVRAVGVRALPGGGMVFTVQRRGAADLPITLNLAGEHNVRNALAAIAVAQLLELPDAPVVQALAQFAGVGRRFTRHGDLPAADGGRFTLIDDYGHHPVEMAAVLAAARGAFPGRRLVLAFQPHRYTRTRDCLDEFVAVMGGFDAVLLTEVYAAGEPPIAAASGRALAQALRRAGAVDPVFVDDVAALPVAIASVARGGDVLITMGAGSIGTVPARLQQMLLETQA